MVEDYILELFEEELAELEMQDDELLMVLEEPDQLPKDSFVRLNYLLDSKIDFKLQEVNEQLGINILPNQLSTFKLLMCNFWNTERMIGISIGNNLTPPKEWNPHGVTYTTQQGVVKKLEAAKLIYFKKGKRSINPKDRRISLMEAKPDLIQWMINKGFEDKKDLFINADTHVRLRTLQKKDRFGKVLAPRKIVSYKPTNYTRYIDKTMKRYHKKLASWGIAINGELLENIHLFVNYAAVGNQVDHKGNYLIRHGGRWWGEWNRTSQKNRLDKISFENVKYERLVELDYISCGPNALYMWETGEFYPGDNHDCYVQFTAALAEEMLTDASYTKKRHRDFIKGCVKIGMNHGRKGIEKVYLKDKLRKGMSEQTKTRHKVDARSMVERVIDDFKWSHKPIKDWVFKGGVTGRRAMFIESNLVLGVLNKLVKEGIPCVSIYDSFVIPEQFEQRAKELMYAPNNLVWLKKLLAKDQQGQLK